MPVYILNIPTSDTKSGVVSFEADNDTVAWYTCLQVGQGLYMPERSDGNAMYPSNGFNLYGTQEDADKWLQDTFGDLDRWLTHNQVEVIRSLDSFMYNATGTTVEDLCLIPEKRDSTASLLARISNTPSLGDQQAAQIINTARQMAAAMSVERAKEINSTARPSINSMAFNRNFKRWNFPGK